MRHLLLTSWEVRKTGEVVVGMTRMIASARLQKSWACDYIISHRGFKGACKTLCWVLVYYAISFFLLFFAFSLSFLSYYGPIPIKHFISYEHLQIGEREHDAEFWAWPIWFHDPNISIKKSRHYSISLWYVFLPPIYRTTDRSFTRVTTEDDRLLTKKFSLFLSGKESERGKKSIQGHGLYQYGKQGIMCERTYFSTLTIVWACWGNERMSFFVFFSHHKTINRDNKTYQLLML